jgi:DeoR/GlpR family transcriptional regulator of sugar metabolism
MLGSAAGHVYPKEHTLLAAVRHAQILEEINRAGAVRVSQLTGQLGVSEMTVRRDLDMLARQGLLAKVHGGAISLDHGSTVEPGFELKSGREQIEKESIASIAASLIEPGSAVALTAGTTTWTVARRIADVPNLTLVTNSIRIAEIMYEQERPDRTVVITGGVRTPSDALVGPVAVSAIRALHVDVVIMGVHGIDPRAGLTTPNLLEAETNRAFVEAAKRLVIVADHTKWGVVGLSEIAPLSSVDVLVTDDQIDGEARRLLSEIVEDVRLAPVATQAVDGAS